MTRPSNRATICWASAAAYTDRMAPDTATLLREALALDADQRAVLANVLLESLHDQETTSEVDAAWKAEATRRLAEVRSGAVDLVDADQHYAKLRASLTA